MIWFKSVRSLVTLGVTITFCKMAWVGQIPVEEFIKIILLVFAFYFVVKHRNNT